MQSQRTAATLVEVRAGENEELEISASECNFDIEEKVETPQETYNNSVFLERINTLKSEQ